jgi:hypothetical protein
MRARINGLAVAVVVAALGTGGCPSQRLQEGQLSSSARFGRSVSISGRTAAVGAYNDLLGAGAAYVYALSGDVWNLQARLVPNNPATGDQFGDRVALSDDGNTLAVSATAATWEGAVQAGAVYIFQRTGTSWTQQATLHLEPPQQTQGFGSSIAFSGNHLVVGAANTEQDGLMGAGAAYVSDFSDGVWSSPTLLPLPILAAGDAFGSAVAISGEALFVGAPGRSVGNLAGAGAVFVYFLDEGGWSIDIPPLSAGTPQASAGFGGALSVSTGPATPTKYLVVGASDSQQDGSPLPGAAYLFTNATSRSFTQSPGLVSPNSAASDLFGAAVAISTDGILIGAPGANGGAGAGYMFDLSGGAAAQGVELPASPAEGDELGGAVALSGSFALVGATEEQVDGLASAGAVHAFREVTPGVWSASDRLAASEGTPGDNYGVAVAVSSDTLVAATYSSVDVYRRDPDGWSLTQQIPIASAASVVSVSTDAGRLAIFSSHNRNSMGPVGTVDVYLRGDDGTWRPEQELTPIADLGSPGVLPTEAAESGVVILSGDKLAVGASRYDDGEGAVLVYTRSDTGSGSTWTSPQSPQVLWSATAGIVGRESDLNFGSSLALDSDTLIVAEPFGTSLGGAPNQRSGQVHIYSLNGSMFTPSQPSITAPSPGGNDGFGQGVAVSGDYLAVRGEAPGNPVRVYWRSNGVFSSVPTWTSQPGVAVDKGLAFDGDRLAIGFPAAAVGTVTNGGQVRIYQVDQSDHTLMASATWTPFDFAAGNGFGTAVAFNAGHAVASNAPSQSAPGDVYGTDP